jgi:hypothetical protein
MILYYRACAGGDVYNDGDPHACEHVERVRTHSPAIFLSGTIAYINSDSFMGDENDAVQWLTDLRSEFPSATVILYHRACAHAKAGNKNEAKNDLQEFIAKAAPGTMELADAKKLLTALTEK